MLKIFQRSFFQIPGQGLVTESLKNEGFTVLSEEEILEAAELLEKIEAQGANL